MYVIIFIFICKKFYEILGIYDILVFRKVIFWYLRKINIEVKLVSLINDGVEGKVVVEIIGLSFGGKKC